MENEALPLINLDDVWNWEKQNASKWPVIPLQPSTEYCYRGNFDFCHSSESQWKQTSCLARSGVPKTLLCHDMKGGYLGDRFINGTDNPDEYRFFRWCGIDIFVYFSHHLITIPPPGWINAAHLHGVKVLGTFITEWDDGEKICKEILQSDASIELFVEKLTNISVHYGFDGWLINIENKVCDTVCNVQKLVFLVKQIKNKMHAALDHSLVIWYDSVTIPNGELKWQNELNVENKEFFDNCDGIFLNYTWKEENLVASKSNAQDRYLDVYVGVDVFGRNCFGGGGFNTSKALEMARKYGLSVAIFAPGWVHETLDNNKFTLLEYHFWNLLQPHLYFHGPCKLPFKTSFCQGFGKKQYHLGKEVSSTPWYNLSSQQFQPSSGSCRHISLCSEDMKTVKHVGMHGCVEMYLHDAFSGGSSLLLSNSFDPEETKLTHDGEVFLQRILVCGFQCTFPLVISLAIKHVFDTIPELCLLLKMNTLNGQNRVISLQGNKMLNTKSVKDAEVFLPIDEIKINEIKNRYSFTNEMDWSHLNANDGNWEMRHYILNNLQGSIVEIGAELIGAGSVLLGFLSLQELKH